MPTMTNTTTTTPGLRAELDRAGILVFTYPDHLTPEQRGRIGATMTTIFGALVEDARRMHAAVAVTR